MPSLRLRGDTIVSAAADVIVAVALAFFWQPVDPLWQWVRYVLAAVLVIHAVWELSRGRKPPA